MDTISFIMVLISAIIFLFALLQDRPMALQGLQLSLGTIWQNLPLLLSSFLIAGMLQVLIPRELINAWLGNQAGTKGIVLGCLAGGLIPGSPYAIFPIVASLYKAGASLATVVSFVTAWSLWSVSRLPVEMALIEPRAALVRFLITFLMPPIAGLVTLAAGKFL